MGSIGCLETIICWGFLPASVEAVPHRFRVVLAHCLYEIRCANDVVSVIQHWETDGLAHCFLASKMYYSVKPAQ